MNNLRKILAFIFSLTAFASMAATDLRDYQIKVGDFDQLKVVNSINVRYRCNPDSSGMLTFRAPSNLSDIFLISNDKGKVRIETSRVLQPGETVPAITIYSGMLTKVVNSGDSTVSVNRALGCPTFEAKQVGNGTIVVDNVTCTTLKAFLNTGNGTIVVSGQCSHADLKMVGTGVIQADGLRASEVNCSILGSGSIGCYPLYNLNVKGIGSTKIYYRGNPEIKKKGGGKLFQIQNIQN